jgi:predicted TIM-barrel fold metal-dependent hydrolase
MTRQAVIDADGHVHEPHDMWPKYLEPRYRFDAPKMVTDSRGIVRRQLAGRMLPYTVVTDKEWQAPKIRAGGHDPQERLKDMDSEGIDTAYLFPTVAIQFGGVDNVNVLAALCRAYNNWVHDYTRIAPDRLAAIAALPQLDMYEMLAEAERAVSTLQCAGVFLRPNPIGGRTLDDPYFEPLWSLLEDLGVPVCIHEGMTQNVPAAGLDRYDNYLFRHAVSHTHEQQMACLEILCGGVLERHPKLRVAFLESGVGWIASWLERLDHHMKSWGHTSAKLPHRPSDYFKRQCFISTESEEAMIPGIIQVMGDDNIVWASDYPHPDAQFPGVVAEMINRKDLSEASKSKILSENARRLFHIKPSAKNKASKAKR